MTIKTRHYFLVILLVMLLSIGGVNKVSYELYQILDVEEPLAVEVVFAGEKIKLYLLDHKKTIDLNRITEAYRERVQSILTWGN